MQHELTPAERYDLLRATLKRLASLPQLSNDEFGYIVFEDLDPDVWSCFHESNLDPLTSAECITTSVKTDLLKIRSSFCALIDTTHAAGWVSIPKIRRDDAWLEMARRSEKVLSGLPPNLPQLPE